MPKCVQLRMLSNLAERFQTNFIQPGSAEASFLSTARFKGFSDELIETVAVEFWPNGYAALKQRGTWQLRVH